MIVETLLITLPNAKIVPNKAKEAKSTFDTFHKDNLPALEEAENLTKKILKKKY